METFESPRLLRVHPGPVRLATASALVVLRAVEVYRAGVAVAWTSSPAQAGAGRLAQGVPRVGIALADDAGTAYGSLGESSSGGGRTLFGTAFFDAAPPAGIDALTVTASVRGASGADVAVLASVRFPLAP